MNTPNQLCQVFKRRFPMKIQIKTTTLKKSQWVQTPSAEVAFWAKKMKCAAPKKKMGRSALRKHTFAAKAQWPALD